MASYQWLNDVVSFGRDVYLCKPTVPVQVTVIVVCMVFVEIIMRIGAFSINAVLAPIPVICERRTLDFKRELRGPFRWYLHMLMADYLDSTALSIRPGEKPR